MPIEIINGNGDNKHTSHNLLGFNNMLVAITQTLPKSRTDVLKTKLQNKYPPPTVKGQFTYFKSNNLIKIKGSNKLWGFL